MHADQAHFESTWPAVPASVPHARNEVVAAIREHTADPPLSDIRLVVSEAVSNAINHAYVGRDPGRVTVRVTIDADEVTLMVEDDGRGMTPRMDSPGMGLGLPLIASACDRFDLRAAPSGGTRLCAWFRHDVAMPV